MSRININRLASQMLRPNQPAFLPPADEMQMHLATVNSNDAGRNQSTVTLNDPNGTVLSQMPVLKMSSSNPYTPTQGDVVQVLQIGNSMALFARQEQPVGIVSFP